MRPPSSNGHRRHGNHAVLVPQRHRQLVRRGIAKTPRLNVGHDPTKMRIIVAGYLVRNPLGGSIWTHQQYPLGLHRLGHRAVYHRHELEVLWQREISRRDLRAKEHGVSKDRRIAVSHGTSAGGYRGTRRAAQETENSGWHIGDALKLSRDVDTYRNYLQQSPGELN